MVEFFFKKMKKTHGYKDSKMKCTYIRKSSTLSDMKGAIYRSLSLDLQ